MVAIEANDLTRKLRLEGPRHRTVILTRAGGQSVAVIAERISESP